MRFQCVLLYIVTLHIGSLIFREAWYSVFSSELKKGSTEMLVLSLLESRPRHGYEIGKLIEARSGGRLKFALPTLYPALLRLENRGWIKGRWVEKAGQRERCFYRLTAEGRRVLAEQRKTWKAYVAAVNDVMSPGRA
jgi:PadR family transcriptional regulator PadR